jgi:omega-6 fatty acid desaturase (delta-12 desaturase)
VGDPTSDWKRVCAGYRTPSDAIATKKLLLNVTLIALTWAAMVWAVRHAVVVVVPLGLLSALLFNQLFLFQHDMGHNAFFASSKKNELVGVVVCVFMLTPFREWTRSHAFHHRNVARLDRRVPADIYTMTVDEWRGAPRWQRGLYRVFRHPFTLLVVAPLWYFFVANRIKGSVCPGLPRGKNLVNVQVTTIGFASFALLMSALIGWRDFVVVEAATLLPGGALGLWIFYLGHSFDHTWYAPSPDAWSHQQAALRGASFCRMPRWLAWFLADIGYHHVHHLDPRIPSYRLRQCHDDNPQLFGAVRPISVGQALHGLLWLRLYDQQRERLVPFSAAALKTSG